ncbi:transcriptional regulator [Bradyrhizobium sp. WSM 1704]|uniref:transcriptional regulator n=1 Tax=Bradyrhizobium semiaridum TaxID=2821404 RepID=UPI001CE275BB|nr:transcriptional regulator [Bradyrhizobium semiaridum]MCA6124029.1 transcriptional regulator [Bradyrhizobium semiaridum]
MNVRKSAVPSPAAVARADRQRIAAEEGVRAIADIERRAIEVRKNMERLRKLREAKEVADAALAATLPSPAPKKHTRRSPRSAASTPNLRG